jgi:hypothetical protein
MRYSASWQVGPGELVRAGRKGRGGGCGGGNEYLGRELEQRGWGRLGFETYQMMAGRRAGGISHEALTRGVYYGRLTA